VFGGVGGQAAQAVVAAEFDDNDFGVQAEDDRKTGHGVLGGGAAGALIAHFVVVAVVVELLLQIVGIRLAGLQAVAGGDAVAETNKDGTTGCKRGRYQKKCEKRNDKSAANVHISSVAKCRGWVQEAV
jgi:hypothetical protein